MIGGWLARRYDRWVALSESEKLEVSSEEIFSIKPADHLD